MLLTVAVALYGLALTAAYACIIALTLAILLTAGQRIYGAYNKNGGG